MVEITYWPEAFRVTAQGHAGAAGKGEDVVCAAVSTVTCMLAGNVADAYGQKMFRKRPVIKLADGAAEVRASPRRAWRQTMRTIFDALCLGYAQAARTYPEYVRFRIEEQAQED